MYRLFTSTILLLFFVVMQSRFLTNKLNFFLLHPCRVVNPTGTPYASQISSYPLNHLLTVWSTSFHLLNATNTTSLLSLQHYYTPSSGLPSLQAYKLL